MSYLLRVTLQDRPGSLGSLAVALGSVGADILSLDVVERANGYAVDDLVVDVPRNALPDTLITAAEQVRGVRVDSIRPYAGVLDAHRELELVDHVATDVDHPLQTLADRAPATLRVSWATVLANKAPGVIELAASDGAPESRVSEVNWLPLDRAAELDPHASWIPQSWRDADTRLAAAPIGNPDRVLLLGRTGGPNFRPSEIARLGYLTGIVATVIHS